MGHLLPALKEMLSLEMLNELKRRGDSTSSSSFSSCLSSLYTNSPHCKKELAVFPSPAGMSLIKLFLGGNNLVFSRPERVWSVSPAGDGKMANSFLQCKITFAIGFTRQHSFHWLHGLYWLRGKVRRSKYYVVFADLCRDIVRPLCHTSIDSLQPQITLHHLQLFRWVDQPITPNLILIVLVRNILRRLAFALASSFVCDWSVRWQ